MKRILDVLVSAGLLLILAPVLLILTIAILVVLGRPIFFRQDRPGRHGIPFNLVKFRTMLVDVGGERSSRSDEARLGRFGRFLRASSVDELPELWNVLKGDMSLVGPRPLLMEYLERYTPEQARRHEVRPGMTGWAQVNGRNTLSWEERFALDVWYVDNRSFWLDLKILRMTVVKVFKREGISQEGEATMQKFRGTSQ